MTEERLRVLMLAPTPYFADRGCHVRIYEEAKTLIELGVDVRIVTYHLGRDLPGVPTYRITNIPWYTKLEAGPSLHKLYLDLLLFIKALQITPDFRPHLIHAHLHEGAFIGSLLKKIARLPLLFDYQGSLTGECIDHGFFKAGSLSAKIFGILERYINSSSDRIITSASSGTADLINDWGTAPEKVLPLIDGVDTDIFRPLPGREAREKLGISGAENVVAYLGLMSRYQGTDLLLDCIELLKRRGTSVHFLVMGFPEEGYKIKAAERGLLNMITFTGKVNYADAPELLSAADIAVTPKLSKTEANGKIFNYMACALPVVAFDTPVNREALDTTGIYAAYGDAADLADKIADILEDRNKCSTISTETRNLAIIKHSCQSRGVTLLDIYEKLMNPPQ